MFKAVCFCIMAFVSPICFGGKKTYDVSSSFHEINRADVEIRTEKGNYIISKCRNTVKKSRLLSKYPNMIVLYIYLSHLIIAQNIHVKIWKLGVNTSANMNVKAMELNKNVQKLVTTAQVNKSIYFTNRMDT